MKNKFASCLNWFIYNFLSPLSLNDDFFILFSATNELNIVFYQGVTANNLNYYDILELFTNEQQFWLFYIQAH